MKLRLFHLFVLFSLLASLANAGSALAQGQGPLPPLPPGTPVPAPWDPTGSPAHPLTQLAPSTDMSAQTLTLGQPGLSFRYVRTYGTTGVSYFSDSGHLNYPWGLGTDSSGNVWMGELLGNRAMKYDNTGTFVQQIGTAGSPYLSSTTLLEIADVGVDSSGNVWVVDDGADHIAKFNAAGVFQSDLGTIWSIGSDNSHFAYPVSIAFDAAGNIYVSDGAPWWDSGVGNQRIQIFNSAGVWQHTIGVTGVIGSDSNHFHGPRHITIDQPNNRLYVADAGNNRIQIYNISNPLLPTWVATIAPTPASGNQLNNPSGVAVDATHIYVADTDNGFVKVFNKASPYAYITKADATISGQYEFDHPFDVAVDSLGNLYVADTYQTRVQQYTFAGTTFTYTITYGTKVTQGGPYATDGSTYNKPSGVAVGTDGSVFLTEHSGQRLIKAPAAGGAPTWTVGTPGIKVDWDTSDYRLDNPADVALDSAGNSYVADRYHHRVQIYKPNGSWKATVDLPGDCPGGVHIAPTGFLYVASTCNQTVKVFNTALTQVATLGASGVAGSDNAHFNSPQDVAVDAAGTIYVSDQGNNRVQVFNSSRAYVRTIGVTGACAADFGHLCAPRALAIDGSKRLYIADTGNSRVQVLDSSGAYLTTLGGSWGTTSGDMRSPTGVAVDSAGNVFVADFDNDRVQKFSPGVPGWTQMNINGFGDRGNGQVSALAAFNNQLYAGTTNKNAAQLWRSSNGQSWSPVMTNGFGNSKISGFDDLMVFNGMLYAGLWGCANPDCTLSIGGQIWRSADGANWSAVLSDGFRDTGNGEIYKLEVYNNTLFATTWTWNAGHGGEIWSSPSGDAGTWTRVVANGFGDSNNWATTSLESFNGALYAGTWNKFTGGQLNRCVTCTGSDWVQVNLDGFGDATNLAITSLESIGTWLYASTSRPAGAQVWRCQLCDGTDWAKVADNGLGNPKTGGDSGLELYNSQLYFIVSNNTTGTEVWRCTLCDGSDWEQVGTAGFGDSNNAVHADKTEQFQGRLYVGTYNNADGGEVWSPPGIPYPTVSSITRVDASPTTAATVHFTVTFTEGVTGVNAGDFKITKTSALVGSSISGVTGSGTTYTVTVARGTGNGTLRLDLIDDDTILDAATGLKPLGGAGAGNGNFTAGQVYTIPLTVSYKSAAASDGWVLETGENTSVGGTLNSTATTFNLGDDAANKQYRAILSFSTAALPDTAVITSATLKFKKLGQVGAPNPFLTLGNILADVRKGDFGTAPLQAADFQTPASKTSALSYTSTLTAGWYSKALAAANFAFINKLGDTQFRLRFTQDDNNNHVADYLTIYSGNAPAASQPVLIIQYYMP